MEFTVLELSRIQFAVVTIYHYFFVPLSMSLAIITAIFHTTWWRTRTTKYRDLALFCGKLLMATFVVGVVTGLVQEFQFGLAWSDFARYYGDVFGPILALEGMLAFFLEATFIALWYFGWDKLKPGIHLATIWVLALGTLLSAFIILAANSFMQAPTAFEIDPVTGRALMTSFTELVFSELNVTAFLHTYVAAMMTGGALIFAIGIRHKETLARLGAWMLTLGGIATTVTGDLLGKVITRVQPMKMAAAEGLYETQQGAPFSLFALGSLDGRDKLFSIDVPYLLSILAGNGPNTVVQGIDDLQGQYELNYGPGNYVPYVPFAYWSFRFMIGAGIIAMLVGMYYLLRELINRRGLKTDGLLHPLVTFIDRLIRRSAVIIVALPFIANTFGWIFTETARQPWLVFGHMRTEDGISPGTTAWEVLGSTLAFATVYAILAVLWYRMIKYLIREQYHPKPKVTPEPDNKFSYLQFSSEPTEQADPNQTNVK